jgi:hypothetical protein
MLPVPLTRESKGSANVSFIDPKKQAEEQELMDWTEEFESSREAVTALLQELHETYSTSLPNDMVIDMRLKWLLEFLVPAHLDRTTDPFDKEQASVTPTNIDRLQYEVGWQDKLGKMTASMIQSIQRALAQNGQETPNGKQSKLIIPGVDPRQIEQIEKNPKGT